MARSYTTVFFDLDGTLLPMDTDVFMKRYFKALGVFAAENGLDSDMCLGAVMAGVKAMAKSDGIATNHDVFWKAFTKATGLDAEEMKTLFSRFYEGPFSQVGEGVQANPEAARAVAEGAGEEADRLNRTIIERECAAYILDKADALGLAVSSAAVTARWSEEGFWYPWESRAACSESDRETLSAVIEAELGIPAERQSWEESK